MKIENTQVFGFEAAIRGARNSRESWDKSDSLYVYSNPNNDVDIGPNDLKLLSNLVKAGPSDSKFTRMIQVWVDMTLPLFLWSEFDTYKVGVTRNSCSTMYKLGTRDLTLDDFEESIVMDGFLKEFNTLVKKYREDKTNKELFFELKSILPSGYLMKSTLNMNYQVLRTIYFQRRNHRLRQWHTICEWIENLPYSQQLIVIEKSK
jgi:hypothetical protein